MKTVNSFQCKRCKNCCIGLLLPITKYDFDRLLEWKKKNNINTETFRSFFTVAEYKGFEKPIVLLSNPCPFFSDKGCSIYPYRPSICRIYPFEIAPSNYQSVVDTKLGNEIYSKKIRGVNISVFLHHDECSAAKEKVNYSARFLKQIIKEGIKHMIASQSVDKWELWFGKWCDDNLNPEETKKKAEEAFQKIIASTTIRLDGNDVFLLIGNFEEKEIERIILDSKIIDKELLYFEIETRKEPVLIFRIRKETYDKLIIQLKKESGEISPFLAFLFIMDLKGMRPIPLKNIFGKLESTNIFVDIETLQKAINDTKNIFQDALDNNFVKRLEERNNEKLKKI